MIQIPAVMERCAGIDVGKREIAVAIITGPADQEGELQTRLFGTTVPELEKLKRVAGGREVHECGDGEHRLLLDSRQEYP